MSANDQAPPLIEASTLPIKFSWSSQRLALRDSKEDWTGITSPAARRKLQNRLNQRARRERAKQSGAREISTVTKSSTCNDRAEVAPILQNDSCVMPKSFPGVESFTNRMNKRSQPQGCMTAVPEVRALMDRFADHAYKSYMRGEPALSHLPLLVRYNVATSLAKNAAVLGIVEEFYQWDGVSPVNKQGPALGLNFDNGFAHWPVTLHPTSLQLSMEHHPWVDCFPWPQFRDNLLRAFEHTDLCDEDELCHDICDLTDKRETMLMVWGSPEDPQNWEVSDKFLRKWAWLLKDCGQMLMSTNHWRTRRGEPPITPQQFANFVWLSLPNRLRPSGI